MTWQEFTALLALSTAMSFTPGPNTTLSTALAANGGMRRALPFACAVALGCSALLLLCALGVGALVLAAPLLGRVIQWVGIGYLLWLSYKLGQARQLGEANTDQLRIGFWSGAALQFANIKVWMLSLAIVSGWIAGHANTTERLAIVVPTMLVFGFASNVTYAAVGSLLRNWLRGPRGSGQRLVWFNRCMALILIITALWMLTL